MPTFAYEAINETGTKISGALDAESPSQAEAILAAKGYIPLKVSLKGGAVAGGGGGDRPAEGFLSRINALAGGFKITDLIIFTKQFHSMVKAGVPILRLLQVLENQTRSPLLKRTISQIYADVRQGSTLHDALERHPKIFSPLYRSMIKAGEISGTVPAVLERLTYIIEHEAQIKSDVKAALQYPIMVLVALIVAFFVLLTFVIPKFVRIFSTVGIELPLPTKIAITLYTFLTNYWFLVLGGVVAAVIGLVYYVRSEQGRFVMDSVLLNMPLLGPLFLKSAMSRFASIFAILYASGVNVITSLSILSETIGNKAIARQIEQVKEEVQRGQGIAQPLGRAKYFTPMVIDMIAIGEESGRIEEMLREVTTHYDTEVAYQVKGLSDAIGPVLMVGLAAVVGFFALAIFLPMWDLTKMAK